MKKALAGALLIAAACTGENGALVPDYRVLSPDGVQHNQPRFSPDGTRLAWWAPTTDASGSMELWVGNADQSDARALPVKNFGSSPIIWSPDGTRIAIITNNFTFADVAVVSVADGAVKRVSQGAGFEVPVMWHPDGDRLTYYASVAEGTIHSYVTKSSTGATARLLPDVAVPHAAYWSSDGSKIAYFLINGSQWTLWVADSAGRSPRQLTTEGFEIFAFTWGTSVWSPDGKHVVYESRRTGTSDIWTVNVEDGSTRQLTRDVRNDYSASWSPDGKSVAFISDRGRQVDVWLVNAADGVEQRVTDNSDVEESSPVWRAGTNELSFVNDATKSSVWLRNLADGAERQLTPDSIRALWFNLSPDGTQFDYVVARGGAIHDLVVAPLAGGPSRTLVAGGGDVIEPSWSPDGSKIAFQSRRGGSDGIWIIDAAGGAPRQVVDWPGSEFYPRWSGDGRSVYFTADREAKLADIWMAPASGGEAVRVTRDGSVDVFATTLGRSEIFATMISAKDGSLRWAQVRPDGSMRSVIDGGSVFNLSVPRVGDSIAVLVDRPGSGLQAMLVPIAGGRGRDILARGEDAGAWSPDGKRLLFRVTIGGANDLGIFDVATGNKTRITTTPQSEDGPEWTPDGKSIVFRRVTRTRRIYTTDLTKLLAAPRN